MNQFERTELLIGEEAVNKLRNAHVAVFGIGGVGGYATEALARSGVGELTIVDKDDVDITNINRQIIALHSNIGKPKVSVMEERLKDINPDIKVNAKELFFLPDTADQFDFEEYDYIVDAVDTVTAKLAIIEKAHKAGTPVISAMGAGNKLNPTKFEVTDISKTSVCPLARVMRKELKARGINHLKVVYSTEEPKQRSETVASIATVPSVCGLLLANEVIKDLTK
ncbi:MAG: tRNA threonylcarbamoyladenosine dehydratase [Clostridia bacterium]|nr:tRNA threonylcarbamoyladenosine dehydratase [Clostridia bacterium]MBQ1896026.1 tRNA threonylcarbamoyladenosine dehydratase [Clostridia bacterium]MBQ2092396.1 tRNA threonylcarbamoyladenosine dehydratase [Clostridia bacterium]